GTVETIGIRATTVRTAAGSRLIVPNGMLIASRVTNWTAIQGERSIDISAAVASAAAPGRIAAVWKRVAAAHPLIVREPVPTVLFVKMGGGALNLELRAWTRQLDQSPEIRSELLIAFHEALVQEKIPIQ